MVVLSYFGSKCVIVVWLGEWGVGSRCVIMVWWGSGDMAGGGGADMQSKRTISLHVLLILTELCPTLYFL